jgi:hypothetical protein
MLAPVPDLQPQPAAAGPGPSGARRSDIFDGIKQGVLLGRRHRGAGFAAVSGRILLRLFQRMPPSRPMFPGRQRASRTSAGEPASAEAREVANWVVASGDNRKLFFVILDKPTPRCLCSSLPASCAAPRRC